MSGGRFDYIQNRLEYIAEEIENYGDEGYDGEVLKEVLRGAYAVRRAAVYLRRIDWMVSDDDSPETFLERLKEDLAAIGVSEEG